MSHQQRRSALPSQNILPTGEVSGVLETLAAGFSMALARPYLVLLPLLIDLWTWLGTQVRGDSLIVALQGFLVDQGGRNGKTLAADLDAVVGNAHANDLLSSLTPSIFGGLPLNSLMNVVVSFLAPAMAVGVDRRNMYAPWSSGLIGSVDPGRWENVVGYSVLFLLGASVLLAVFLAPIAQAVRGGPVSVSSLCADMLLGWIRLLALAGIFIALATVIGIPLLLMAQLLLLAGINLVAVLALCLMITLGMLALYAYFLLDAMFIYRVGPIRAMKMSYAVARLNIGASWRFAASSILIATGLLRVWDVLIENPPGIIIAIVVNAAVGGGLTIASMMFFHDRARLPRPTFHPSTRIGRR